MFWVKKNWAVLLQWLIISILAFTSLRATVKDRIMPDIVQLKEDVKNLEKKDNEKEVKIAVIDTKLENIKTILLDVQQKVTNRRNHSD